MTTLQEEFRKDCGDRVVEKLTGSSLLANLTPAARTAGKQLEWMKPALMVTGRQGLYAGPAVNVAARTLLTIFADATRVVTIHGVIPPGVSVRAMFDQCIGLAEEIHAGEPLPPVPGFIVLDMLNTWGGAPGGKTPEVDGPGLSAVLGGALASQRDKLQPLVGLIDAVMDEGICPALVGLLGPATSGKADTYSFAWLFLPVGYYTKVILERMGA